MAVTFDFGTCAQCGDNNSKILQQCRSCGTPLPWSKAAKTPAAAAPMQSHPAPPQQQLQAPQHQHAPAPRHQKVGLGDIAWGAMGVQIVGGIIFVTGIFFWCGNVLRFFRHFPVWATSPC